MERLAGCGGGKGEREKGANAQVKSTSVTLSWEVI